MPTEIASDTFTGANGTSLPTHNASWVAFLDTVEIQTNEATNLNTGTGLVGWDAVFSDDQYAEAIFKSDGSDTTTVAGPMVRLSDAAGGGDGYVWISDGFNQSTIFRMDNGAATNLIQVITGVPVDGDTMRIEIRGTRISCLLNGILHLTFSDANYASGDAGMGFSGNAASARIDSWSGGDLDDMQMIIVPSPSWI